VTILQPSGVYQLCPHGNPAEVCGHCVIAGILARLDAVEEAVRSLTEAAETEDGGES